MSRVAIRARRVTSRLFSRCPAAQMRIDSPSSPMAAPAASVRHVRRGEVEHARRRTRTRAARGVARGAAGASHHGPRSRWSIGRRAPVHADVLDAGRRWRCRQRRWWWHTHSAIARHRDVRGAPGPVALGIGWPVEADDGRARRGREMNRPGVAGHQARRRGRARARRRPRRRRQRAAPPDASTTARASSSSARPPEHDRAEPCRSRSHAAISPKRAGGHRLFGHAAPGFNRA